MACFGKKKPKPTIKRALSSFLLRLTAIDEQHNEHWFYYNENHGIIERVKFCNVRLQPLSFTKRFAFRIVCPFAFLITHFGQEEISVFKGETIVQHLSLSYGRTKSFPSLSFYLNIKLRCHKFCEKLIRYSQRNQSGRWFSGGSTRQKKTSFVVLFCTFGMACSKLLC